MASKGSGSATQAEVEFFTRQRTLEPARLCVKHGHVAGAGLEYSRGRDLNRPGIESRAGIKPVRHRIEEGESAGDSRSYPSSYLRADSISIVAKDLRSGIQGYPNRGSEIDVLLAREPGIAPGNDEPGVVPDEIGS
jgi:hypothetical protein